MAISVSRPTIGEEELRAVGEVFASGWLGLGDKVKSFEQELSTYLGGSRVVALGTGTAALHAALAAVGVGPGDEVIVPSLTFVACPQAVVMAGATPVFADVEDESLTLSAEDVRRRMSPRTRAVMPVHYAGHACGMDALLDLAGDKVAVVEDAAHAFGSEYKGRRIGSFGHIACFSFDPIKVLTCGEGGAVSTRNEDWARRVERMRMLGIEGDSWTRYQNKRRWFYDVPGPGCRYHMSNISAAVGLVQLRRLNGFLRRRREVVKAYDAAFRDLPGVRLLRHDVDTEAPFMYVLRVPADRRDDFMAALKARGVDTGVHYIPNHMHSYFKAGAPSLPVTERAFQEIVSLPLFSHMTDEEVNLVTASVRGFFATGGGRG
jgi:perosamine synthetase